MARGRKKLPTDEIDAMFFLVFAGPGALVVALEGEEGFDE